MHEQFLLQSSGIQLPLTLATSETLHSCQGWVLKSLFHSFGRAASDEQFPVRKSGRSQRRDFFSVAHCPKHLCPVASTWNAVVDLFVHLHKLGEQVLALCSLDVQIEGLTGGLAACLPSSTSGGTFLLLLVSMKISDTPASPARNSFVRSQLHLLRQKHADVQPQ